MAQQTITKNPTMPSTSVSGTTERTFSYTVTPPPLPEGVTKWDSITFSGVAHNNDSKRGWTVTIAGTSATVNAGKTATLTGTLGTDVTNAPTSYTATVKGSHKQASGTLTWTNAVITYTYKVPGQDALYINVNGTIREAETVWVNQNGTIVEINPADIDTTKTYHYNGNL